MSAQEVRALGVRGWGMLKPPGFGTVRCRLALFVPIFLSVWLLLINCGCRHVGESVSNSLTPSYKPTNFLSIPRLPDNLRRVADLPLYFEDGTSREIETVDGIFSTALRRTLVSEVASVSHSWLDSRFQVEQLSPSEPLPTGIFAAVRKVYDADAVLFTEITHFRPYRPIAIGVRSSLVDLESGQVIWAFDDLFDSGEPSVSAGAKRFHLAHSRNVYPLHSAEVVLQSPTFFSKYVAYEMFRTLPER